VQHQQHLARWTETKSGPTCQGERESTVQGPDYDNGEQTEQVIGNLVVPIKVLQIDGNDLAEAFSEFFEQNKVEIIAKVSISMKVSPKTEEAKVE